MCKTPAIQGLFPKEQKVTHKGWPVYFRGIAYVYTVEIICVRQDKMLLCKQSSGETGRKSSEIRAIHRNQDAI